MGEDFRMGAKSFRWIKVCVLHTVAPLCTECAISHTMENQRSIRKIFQQKNTQDLSQSEF